MFYSIQWKVLDNFMLYCLVLCSGNVCINKLHTDIFYAVKTSGAVIMANYTYLIEMMKSYQKSR